MDSITVSLLRASVSLLPVKDLGPAFEFYRRLFELAPDTRPLFAPDIGAQAKKFSDMLAWVVDHLEDRDELCQELRKLGARHRDYGVKLDQYAPVGSALIWMFQQTLGERFTAEMEDAWLEAYAYISLEAERGSRGAEAAGR
jgi:hemoglobin-like flavoprotein